MFPTSPFFGLFGLLGLLVLLVLVVIGIIIIFAIVKTFFFILPAAIIALIVWWLTQNEVWAGVAFIAIAILSLLKR